MTNEHIEIVKRWLAGEVFSAETLTANADAAWDAARAADIAAKAAAEAVYVAADAVAAANAAHWVKRYEELTKWQMNI